MSGHFFRRDELEAVYMGSGLARSARREEEEREEVELLTLKKEKCRLLTPKSVAATWKEDHVPDFPLAVFPVFCVRLVVSKFKTSGLHHRLRCMFDISTCGNCTLNIFLIVSNVFNI